MRNNNGAVIRKLTKRSLKSNKKRNAFIITAITLTTILLATVFSIGISIMESLKIQQTRLMGTVAHAAVTRLTRHQVRDRRQLLCRHRRLSQR